MPRVSRNERREIIGELYPSRSVICFEQVAQAIADELDFPKDRLRPELSLVSLDMDSLEKAALISALEETLGCDLPEDDAQKFVTIQDIVTYANREHNP